MNPWISGIILLIFGFEISIHHDPMTASNLKDKRIIIGITGGIAAYKSLLLIRFLIRSGAEVRVIMTEAAKDFVTPLSVSTLSKNKVFSSLFSEGVWENHVELGMWADVFVIAPATANTIAAMAQGLCDDILLATYLSARCPVLVAPAMDLDMWSHPATQRNIEILKEDQVEIIDVESGELASGLSGQGRMAEPENILFRIEEIVSPKIPAVDGKKVVVTAGPTYESLDPVRYLGNWSSGKMGIAIAEEFHLAGSSVTLVLGPSSEKPRFPDIHVIRVKNAREMYDRVMEVWNETDIGIMAAAVADYRPAEFFSEKISKSDEGMTIRLERNPDIAASLGEIKKPDQILIGFAMETHNEIKNAERKLNTKNLDLIVLNSLRDADSGFGTDTNKVTLITNEGLIQAKELQTKHGVARDIIEFISK